MKLIINPSIFKKYPTVGLGIVVAKNINNFLDLPTIQNLLRREEARIREKYRIEDVGNESKITVWRKAYQDFGAKPKDHRSSVENLYKLVLEGNELRHINNLVDIYNFISLKHMLPAGGEDLDNIEGDIELTFAREKEPPVLLLGDKDPRPPHPGEIIYKDNISAICRRWNWREADRTKLTKQTKNCILVVEGLSPTTEQGILTALEELKDLVAKYCGAKLSTAFLNRDDQNWNLDDRDSISRLRRLPE